MGKRIRGSALLSVLFIVAIISAITTLMLTKLNLRIQRTQAEITQDKLRLASEASINWAINQLQQDVIFQASKLPHVVKIYPAKFKHIYPGIQLSGHLYDLQSYFNLNNVRSQDYIATFLNLIEKALHTTNAHKSHQLLKTTQEWIITPKNQMIATKIDNLYLQNKPPYLPAYQPFENIFEWQKTTKLSLNDLKKLSNNLVTLREVTPININTSPKELLATMSQTPNSSLLQQLELIRSKKPIRNIKNIQNLLDKLGIDLKLLTLQSEYFLYESNAIQGSHSLTYYTLLQRKQKNKEISVSVLSINQSAGKIYLDF